MDKYDERINYPALLRQARKTFKKYKAKEVIARHAAGDTAVFCRGLSLEERRALRTRLTEDLLK